MQLAPILAFIADNIDTIGIGGALALVYRDCRRDRAALWKHVRELEEKISR